MCGETDVPCWFGIVSGNTPLVTGSSEALYSRTFRSAHSVHVQCTYETNSVLLGLSERPLVTNDVASQKGRTCLSRAFLAENPRVSASLVQRPYANHRLECHPLQHRAFR